MKKGYQIMNKRIVLCVDEMSILQPELIGLEGESLHTQKWLDVRNRAYETRDSLKNDQDITEIWVLSCDDLEAINLAAALRKDHKTTPVVLIANKKTGSLESRAKAADLSAVITSDEFIKRYRNCKQKALQPEGSCVSSSNVYPFEGRSDSVQTFAEEAVAKNSKEKSALIMPVMSANGGSGKSTTAVLLAYLAQKRGYNTLLLDADLQFGDMHFLMAEQNSVSFDEVLSNPSLLSKVKSRNNSPALLAAPRRLEQSEIGTSELLAFLGHCSQGFDVIVVNTGAFWGEQHITLLERASYAFFLLDQRPSTIRDCRHALDYCARCAVATQPIKLMLNRCSKTSLFSSLDISCGLQGMPVSELQEGGKELSELLGAGQPLDLIASKNPFYVSLEQAVDEFLPSKKNLSSGEKSSTEAKPTKRTRFWRKRGAACL